MQSEQEIRQLKEELEKLTGFIGENGSDEQVTNRDQVFACVVCDALAWVRGEISTDLFRSATHLDLDRLRETVARLEKTTGKKLADYE